MDALKSVKKRKDGFVRESLVGVKLCVEMGLSYEARSSVMIATLFPTTAAQALANSKANKISKNQPKQFNKPKQPTKSSKAFPLLPPLHPPFPPLLLWTPLFFFFLSSTSFKDVSQLLDMTSICLCWFIYRVDWVCLTMCSYLRAW